MACPRCGTTNRPGAKFCVECGAGLATGCPSCGTAVEPGAKFCPECGTPLAGGTGAVAAATPARAASGNASGEPAPFAATERRVVSVLFADLVAFTALAEGRDSEAVRELLGRYFERASEIVSRYGGTVEKFIGDAVMAVWGTPVAHEDDAERAVRAALDLVEAVRELGRQAGGSLQARAGVLTGEATVTIGAQNQGMVAGDLVNTASRLQSVAEPGTVLVGESTRHAAAGAIAFEAAGEQALKGKTAPVEAYRALRVVATVGGAVRSDALEPPFVGRETEFRLLRELFHATGRERRARLVSLTGQAGIGKSRLAWEFQKYLDGISEQLWWHHGRSPAYGEGVTFWALGEMIRKRAGLLEGDDEATGRARIADSVAEHIPTPEERAFVEPTLLALLGLDEPPTGGRDRLFAGWRLFLERLSETSSVVLVFEDVQWADDGMLDFIEHLLEWSRSYPILVVTLARPELLDRRPTWGAGARSASSLALGPLGQPEMRELLAGMVPGLPESAVASVLGRADGIPLYAVETVRMLVADGRLEPDGEGRYRPTAKLEGLEVPATLQALIAARLDALDPADRALLQDASILGKTFTVEALAAVGGTPTEGLDARLRSLVARELLSLDTDPASPERGQYGFVQALIREVAYGTLARRDRRTRHLAAARFFEGRGEDELAPVLASHYLSAYRASPEGAEGDAVRVQARIALRAAAERAAGLGSYGSAVTYLQQALELGAGEDADEADLLTRAGNAALLDGQYDRAEALLARAAERWRGLGDTTRLGGAISQRGLALVSGGHGDRALEVLEAARVEFAGSEHDAARGPIAARIAHVFVRRGAGSAAMEAAEEALVIAEHVRDYQLLLDALITKAAALGQTGRDMEGAMLVRAAREMAAEHGFVSLELRATVNSVVQQIDQDPWRAMELGFEAIDRSRRFGVRPTLIFSLLNTVEVALRVGEWQRVEAALADAFSLELEGQDRPLMLLSAAALACYQGRRGDPRIRELEGLVIEGEDSYLGTLAADYRALAAQLDGDYPTALQLLLRVAAGDDLNAPTMFERACRAALWMGDARAARSVLEAFTALGRSAPLPAVQLAAVSAAVLALDGRRSEAVDAFRDVNRRLRDLRLTFDGALWRLDQARLLGTDTPEGATAADEARGVFVQLGAQALVDVVDGLTAGARPEATAPTAGRRAAAERTRA